MNKKILNLLKDNFKYLFFFYKYLKNKILYIVIISFLVSLLDALSLSIFLPLLDVSSNKSSNSQNNDFVLKGMQFLHLPTNTNVILLVMLVFFILKALIRYIDVRYRIEVTSFFIKKIRKDFLTGIINLDYKKFISTDLGSLQNMLTAEVPNVISAFSQYLSVFQNVIFVSVYLSMSLLTNPKFTIIVIFGGVVSSLILKTVYVNSEKLSFSITNKNNVFSSYVMQLLLNFKYLKSTANNHLFNAKVFKLIDETEDEQKKLGKINGIALSVREPIVVFFLILAIFIHLNVFDGNIKTVILSLLFFYRAFNSLMNIQLSWSGFLKYVGAINNLKIFQVNFMNNKEENGKISFERIKSEIEFKNVSFSFQNDAKSLIIENLNLKISKNSTIAIVGKSGSGKTTLLNLITGLLKPTKGEVCIDNLNLNQLDINTLRSKIGFISQESVIFNDTIFNNVTLWDEKNFNSLKKFHEALKSVDMIEFLNNNDAKEDLYLGDNGVLLSGGQKQRLSIARELYKQNEILILDEATSSLDSETEKIIQASIDKLKGKITIIIIAHRLSTVKKSDQILLLSNGKIQSQGSFDELILKSKDFARMVEFQNL